MVTAVPHWRRLGGLGGGGELLGSGPTRNTPSPCLFRWAPAPWTDHALRAQHRWPTKSHLKRGQSPLELAGGGGVEHDALPLQALEHVGLLADHPDGPQDGEGGGHQPVGRARHHVPSARRHLRDEGRAGV